MILFWCFLTRVALALNTAYFKRLRLNPLLVVPKDTCSYQIPCHTLPVTDDTSRKLIGKPFWLDAVKWADGNFYYNPVDFQDKSLKEVSSVNFIDHTNVNQEVGSCITATGKTGSAGKFTKEVADCDRLDLLI